MTGGGGGRALKTRVTDRRVRHFGWAAFTAEARSTQKTRGIFGTEVSPSLCDSAEAEIGETATRDF